VSRRASAVAALVAMLTIVIGVPLLLVLLVGNPWPGSTRLALGDAAAVVVGVLALLVWVVWARFVVAVVVEVGAQLAELREPPPPTTPTHVRLAPPPARAGTGLLAQRLVAAVLVLLPLGPRSSTAHAADDVLAPAGRAVATAVSPVPAAASPVVPAAVAAVDVITVRDGDTLFGLARTHLGESARWREIFELNRDRLQLDGGRLTSPSLIRTGWRLTMPAGIEPTPAEPAVVSDEVVVATGDTLWDLARARLVAAGLDHGDVAVADYVHRIVAANGDVIEDPDLIYAGERLHLPTVGAVPGVSESAPEEADATPPAPPPVEPPVAPPAEAVMSPTPDAVAPPVPAAAAPSTPAPTTTTTPPAPAPSPPSPVDATPSRGSPSPIGLGEAALLSAGVLALVGARRRFRLRTSQPRARVPEPPPEAVAAERKLRAVDAGERLLRVDIAVRAAAASLIEGPSRIAIVTVGADGAVELVLSSDAALPAPWEGGGTRWMLPGATPIELLAEAARSVGAPCAALAQLGVSSDGREVLADLEAIGLLAIDAPPATADAVVNGIGAALASSIFAEVASLVGTAVDADVFLDHRHAHLAPSVDSALELAATLVGGTSAAAARHSTFVLRARHTSGEAWEPAVVLVGSAAAREVSAAVARTACRRHGALAMVVGAAVPDAPCVLRPEGDRWTLAPWGLDMVPVGLAAPDVSELHAVLAAADAPLVVDEPLADVDRSATGPSMPSWTLMVRLLGSVDVVDGGGRAAAFERSKALELVAWLTMHRERATRAGARTALWNLDVRDATFANVVSEARRAMARLVEPPPDGEWLGRTLTDVLPLHPAVVADVDVVRHCLDGARLQPPELAIDTLRPAVELIRDLPFAGTGYLWPDAEGIQSNLVLLATSAATELAGHYLSMGDVEGVFWATARGLRVLPGHEELIALRMRAHARAGDLSGVRQEWESYERVLNADPWSDGEPAPKLVLLRRELLSS
jgi:hypothetical protein